MSSAAVKEGKGGAPDAPSPWMAVLDKASGEYYYWNEETDETTWERVFEEGRSERAGKAFGKGATYVGEKIGKAAIAAAGTFSRHTAAHDSAKHSQLDPRVVRATEKTAKVTTTAANAVVKGP